MRLHSSVTEIFVVRDMAHFLRACHSYNNYNNYVMNNVGDNFLHTVYPLKVKHL